MSKILSRFYKGQTLISRFNGDKLVRGNQFSRSCLIYIWVFITHIPHEIICGKNIREDEALANISCMQIRVRYNNPSVKGSVL